MRVAFIFPIREINSRKKPLRFPTYINLGISYVSSVLKSGGHVTRLFVLTPQNARELLVSVEEFDPGLVCFTSLATTHYLVQDFAKLYKQKHPAMFLIAGGCHVSLNPDEVIADAFDAICIGEGEYPALELAGQLEQGLKPSKIRNLWIKNGGRVEKNPTRPFIENLDRLPFPDRGMWKEYLMYPERIPAILLGRGCPFTCTYCCNHKLAKLSPGKYVRYRSPPNVLGEIREYLAESPECKEIYFEVETIGVDIRYVRWLCSELEQFNREREQLVAFGVNLRVTPHMDCEALFDTLGQAHFTFVEIGLESGSERVRTEILKRHYSNSDIIKAAESAKRHRLRVYTYNLIGLPGETVEDFRETIALNRRIQPEVAGLSIFYPYPGTELARLCKEKGLIDERIDVRKVRERVQPVLKLPDLSRKEILHSFVWFDYNVFKGQRPLFRVLLLALKARVLTSPFLYRFFNILLTIPVLVKLKYKLVN